MADTKLRVPSEPLKRNSCLVTGCCHRTTHMCLIVKVCQGKCFQPAYLDERPSNSLIVCPRSPFYTSASVTEASLLRLICRTDKSLWMLPNIFWIPPHRVGPGPDARHRHQRQASRDRTPTTGPSGDGPPSGPEPPGAVGTGHRAEPRHRPPRRRPPHPGRRPPPPTYRQ